MYEVYDAVELPSPGTKVAKKALLLIFVHVKSANPFQQGYDESQRYEPCCIQASGLSSKLCSLTTWEGDTVVFFLICFYKLCTCGIEGREKWGLYNEII